MAASDSCVSNLYADALAASITGRKSASRELFWTVAVLVEISLDFLVTTGCVLIALSWQIHPIAGSGSLQKLLLISMAAGLATTVSLRNTPARRWSCTLIPIWETERILRATVQCSLILLLAAILAGLRDAGAALACAVVLVPVSLIGLRRAWSALLRALYARDWGADRVVIYGETESARQIASTLIRSPRQGLHPVALVMDEVAPGVESLFRVGGRRLQHIEVTREALSAPLLHSLRCDLLVIAAPHVSEEQIRELRDIAAQAHSSIAVLQAPGDWAGCMDIGGARLLSNVQPVGTGYFEIIKRLTDVVLSLALLILLAPLMLLIALLIWLDSPGPVLFLQERVGRNGQMFSILKFRSMHVSAPAYQPSPIHPRDPRITRVGRLLRRAGLDELPQLLNVLFGHMSLVGPRPEMPFLVERYREQHGPRLLVTPGITGLWQLSADRLLPIHENTHYDLYYIRNRTLCMDWAILVHTLFFAIRGGV